MNEFEQQLGHVPVKQIPADWRAEILGAAERAPVLLTSKLVQPRASFQAQLHALLWPHPKAWAGLAAVWLVILALDFSQRDGSLARREDSAPPSPAMRAELRQQQQLLTELMGTRDTSDADRPRLKPPQPRTELIRILMT
jgi:hypothetical protein